MFIITAFEILLFVSRTVSSPAHLGTRSEIVECFVNKSVKSNDEIELLWGQKITSFMCEKNICFFSKTKIKRCRYYECW